MKLLSEGGLLSRIRLGCGETFRCVESKVCINPIQ
jgi:hypothetical protein